MKRKHPNFLSIWRRRERRWIFQSMISPLVFQENNWSAVLLSSWCMATSMDSLVGMELESPLSFGMYLFLNLICRHIARRQITGFPEHISVMYVEQEVCME